MSKLYGTADQWLNGLLWSEFQAGAYQPAPCFDFAPGVKKFRLPQVQTISASVPRRVALWLTEGLSIRQVHPVGLSQVQGIALQELTPVGLSQVQDVAVGSMAGWWLRQALDVAIAAPDGFLLQQALDVTIS